MEFQLERLADAMDDSQSQAGSLLLGGKERLIDSLQMLLADPRSIIVYVQSNRLSTRIHLDSEDDFPGLALKGLTSVEGQIHKKLFDEIFIADHVNN